MISCKGVVVYTAVWAARISHAWAAEEQAVTSLPIEQLPDIEVSTAARYGQKQSEAAAAISVATAAMPGVLNVITSNLFNRQYRDSATLECLNGVNQRLDSFRRTTGACMARLDYTL